MFTSVKKIDWINDLSNKLSVLSEETESTESEKKETKNSAVSASLKKIEINLDDMSSAQKVALIKTILKHCNDTMEDAEFNDFMEKIAAAVDEYAVAEDEDKSEDEESEDEEDESEKDSEDEDEEEEEN